MENDTFTVNTPSVSATKCWPGDLGVYATHALVFAQMIVQGQNKLFLQHCYLTLQYHNNPHTYKPHLWYQYNT